MPITLPEYLDKPTVAEVIAVLSQLDPATLFEICDADTQWTINIVHIELSGRAVTFFGEYEEMNS